MRMTALCLVVALLVLDTSPSRGEWTPPGDYSRTGTVVRRADGRLDLFSGYGCLLTLPDPLAAKLAPYLGKRVQLDFTRAEAKNDEIEVFDPVGAPIRAIRKITVLPPAPFTVTLTFSKPSYALAEPVVATVTVQAVGEHALDLDRTDIEVNLLHDYRSELRLLVPPPIPRVTYAGPPVVELRATPPPAKPAKAPPPSERSFVVTLRSDRIGKPGTFDAMAMVGERSDRSVLSSPVSVTVRAPADVMEETAALRAWLHAAAPQHQVRMAEQLVARGDRSGVGVVIGLLEANTPIYGTSAAYRFVWQHGGPHGERLLMERLKRVGNQASARSLIEPVHLSPRRTALLHRLLADERAVFSDISGWCDQPRICDITASWLCGYTNGARRFPKTGTQQARDRAVQVIRSALDDNPAQFSILADR